MSHLCKNVPINETKKDSTIYILNLGQDTIV